MQFNKYWLRVFGPLALLAVFFLADLMRMIDLSRRADLFSHLPLIPVVTGYLIWIRRRDFAPAGEKSCVLPVILGTAGILSIVLSGAALKTGWNPSAIDALALRLFALVCLVAGWSLFVAGRANLKLLAFPLGFLFLMVPMPDAFVEYLTISLQRSSAMAAYWMIYLTGTPIFRDGLVFHLPNITMEVAPECSGIRSTVVLFITSLLAGHLFLESGWKKGALALLVIPLGILRNGFRILVIGWMSANVDRNFIESAWHHRGGPVFFLISLIPLFALLVYFRRIEQRQKPIAMRKHELSACATH